MRLIDADALLEYAMNQKEHQIGPNEIARFPGTISSERIKLLLTELENAKSMIRLLLIYSSPDNCPYCANRDSCNRSFDECYQKAKWHGAKEEDENDVT